MDIAIIIALCAMFLTVYVMAARHAITESRRDSDRHEYGILLTPDEAQVLLAQQDPVESVFTFLADRNIHPPRDGSYRIGVNWTANSIPDHGRIMTGKRLKEIEYETNRRVEEIAAKARQESGL